MSAGKVRGGEDVKVEQIASCPQLQIKPDRAAIAPYGINVEDVNTLSNRLSPERKRDKSMRETGGLFDEVEKLITHPSQSV